MINVANTKSGVYPCYENQFSIGAVNAETLSSIADCVSFGVSFEDNVEEWTPYSSEGWKRRLKTGKGVTISVTAKRNVGDTGNDFVAGLAFKNGRESECDFQWNFPDSTIVKFGSAVINLKSLGGGDSTNVAPLEFDIMSNGKPTITEPA